MTTFLRQKRLIVFGNMLMKEGRGEYHLGDAENDMKGCQKRWIDNVGEAKENTRLQKTRQKIDVSGT